MKKLRSLAIGMFCAALGLTGCGGGNGNSGPRNLTTQILSDPSYDGDIEQTSSTSFTITQGMSPTVQSVLAGIDPVSLTEIRAFLDFPLTGPAGVPSNAVIESAFLEIFIDNLLPTTGSLPVLIELVAFQPPTLLGSDFDRTLQPPLAFTRIVPAIAQADVGGHISINVTSLMVQAQQLGLVDFQVRIMEDLGPAIPVLVEINDTTGVTRGAQAPQLTVTYF